MDPPSLPNTKKAKCKRQTSAKCVAKIAKTFLLHVAGIPPTSYSTMHWKIYNVDSDCECMHLCKLYSLVPPTAPDRPLRCKLGGRLPCPVHFYKMNEGPRLNCWLLHSFITWFVVMSFVLSERLLAERPSNRLTFSAVAEWKAKVNGGRKRSKNQKQPVSEHKPTDGSGRHGRSTRTRSST